MNDNENWWKEFFFLSSITTKTICVSSNVITTFVFYRLGKQYHQMEFKLHKAQMLVYKMFSELVGIVSLSIDLYFYSKVSIDYEKFLLSSKI